ncbi:MAG TPA: hypothetical protein VHG09_01615 [Longimicrobiales bacterium]|nr:hypothetical protein [Longimicrobiales bacterium]
MSLRLPRQSSSIGIAVGIGTVTGVMRRGSTLLTHVVAVELTGTGDDSPALTDAFAALRAHLIGSSADGAVVDIAILPPLCDARLIPLPPLRAAEAEAVLRRDAARYFVGVPAPHIIAVRPDSPTARGRSGGSVLAAAAGAAFVDAISAAAAAAGWEVHGIAPAHAAWTTAATRTAKQGTAGGAYVAVIGDIAHVVRLSGRRAAAVRRLPVAAMDDIVAAATGTDSRRAGARVAIFANDAVGAEIGRGFAAAGWSVTGDDDAALVAARSAGDAGVRFVTATIAAERSARDKHLATRLVIAAAVLVVLGGVLEMWGARREWNAIRERRAEIREEVAPLLAVRDSIDRLIRQTNEIEAQAREIPRWTPALFDLALLLPQESHLTGLFATGDTLVIEAQGAGAGTALEALRAAGSLRDARLIGTVDRELDGGATSMERFRLSARLAQSAPPTVAGVAGEEAPR